MELKAKILDYINQNIDGVKISEMEKSLCEKKMILGFILRNLEDEGKILKIEDNYYPNTGFKNSKNNNSQLNKPLNNQLLIN